MLTEDNHNNLFIQVGVNEYSLICRESTEKGTFCETFPLKQTAKVAV